MQRSRQGRGRTIADHVAIFLLGCCMVLLIQNNWGGRSSQHRNQQDIDVAPPHSIDEDTVRKRSAELERVLATKKSSNKLTVPSISLDNDIRILCFVKTHPSNHKTKCIAVKQTWGQQCDKLIFFSSETDNSLPSINAFEYYKSSKPGLLNDTRKTLTEKVFSGLKYIYTRYGNDYDWFQEADDDTYVIVDNLRHFVRNKNPDSPLYFGHKFMRYARQGFTSGGAAYVMSREALKRMMTRGKHQIECNRKGQASDMHVSRCLEEVGVVLGTSVDSLGRSRFHCFDIEIHYSAIFPDWYINFTNTVQGAYANHMADYPITFHYVDPRRMYTVYNLLHNTRIHGHTTPSIVYE